MRKTAKIKTGTRRSARSAQSMGRTKEGLPIPKPDFKPQSFTLQQLDRAVRAVKLRQAASQAG